MTIAKLYNMINGIFYALYGLYGVFMPLKNAGFLGIELPGTLGLHEWRAYNGFFVAFGLLLIGATLRRTDQRPIVLTIIFITLGFLFGRLVGLVMDGTGPMLTYYEIALEVVIVLVGTLLFRATAPKTLT